MTREDKTGYEHIKGPLRVTQVSTEVLWRCNETGRVSCGATINGDVRRKDEKRRKT